METSCKLEIVLLLVTSLACSRAELPYGMKPCARNASNLSTCVLKMARDTMNYIIEGNSKLYGKSGSVPVDSFTLNVYVDELLLDFVGKAVKWHGFNAAAISNLKFDLDKMKMSFDLSIPSMKIGGTCAVNGHIGDLEINADGERFPYATIFYSINDEFSADLNFKLQMKTNASGTFLIPVLTSYNPHLNVGTVTLENIFPVGYVPDQRKVDLLKKAEYIVAKYQRDLFAKLLGRLIENGVFVILQLDTYDQFFPWMVSVGSIPAVTCSWLMVVLVMGTSTLLKSI